MSKKVRRLIDKLDPDKTKCPICENYFNNEHSFTVHSSPSLRLWTDGQVPVSSFKNRKTISDDELPKISIITPSLGRKNLFRMAQQNWLNFDYPKDKMEWIILNEGEESYLSMVKGDSRIKYIHIYNDLIVNLINR